MSPAFQYRLRTTTPLVSVEDFRGAARRALPKMVWAYLDGGAEDERTMRSNREAFTKWRLRQRVLAGHKDVDVTVDIDGQPLAIPVILSPTGLTGLAHWSGELAAARAAERAGTRLTLSTASSYSIAVPRMASETSRNRSARDSDGRFDASATRRVAIVWLVLNVTS